MAQMRDEFAGQMRETMALQSLDQIVAWLAAVTGPNPLLACWARTVAAGRAGLPFTTRDLSRMDRMTHIPNGPLRYRVDQAIRRRTDLTLSDIARRAGMDFTYLKRVLGMVDGTSSRRNGRFYAGRRQTVIAVATAATIATAAHIAPSEIPGL
jgi:AraC-like DNA-binding protein